jgi:hypothetical protein
MQPRDDVPVSAGIEAFPDAPQERMERSYPRQRKLAIAPTDQPG